MVALALVLQKIELSFCVLVFSRTLNTLPFSFSSPSCLLLLVVLFSLHIVFFLFTFCLSMSNNTMSYKYIKKQLSFFPFVYVTNCLLCVCVLLLRVLWLCRLRHCSRYFCAFFVVVSNINVCCVCVCFRVVFTLSMCLCVFV